MNTIIRKAVVINVLLLLLYLSFSEQLLAQPSALYFANLDFNNGLSSNNTNCLVQDGYGFIWIGTDDGLCRYDGVEMQVFKNGLKSNSIPSNNISSLQLDGEKLWVGTSNGLCTIDTRTFKIHRINFGSFKAIRALFKDSKEQIWIGTAEGILLHNKIQNKYVVFNTENSKLSHNTIRSFYEARNGDIWVGTYNGLNRFANGRFTSYNLKGNYKPLLNNNLILTIKPFNAKSDSLLWVGTETGLCLFNTLSGNYTVYNSANTELSNEVVKCIYTEDDLVWLGTDFGLDILSLKDNSVNSFYHNPIITHSISNNVVRDIFHDNNNILWFATSNGISRLNRNSSLYKIYEEFYAINGQKAGNQVRDILITPDGSIWLATIHGVLKKSHGNNKRVYFTSKGYSQERLLLDNVYALECDKYNRIWIGTAGGINVWDEKKQKMIAITANAENGLLSNYISDFIQLNDGSFYVSAWEGGLFKINGNFETLSNIKFTLVDSDGIVGALSSKNSLYYKNQNSFFMVNNDTLEKSAMQKLNKVWQSMKITCYNSDSKGVLYLGGNNGIATYNTHTDSVKLYNYNLGGLANLLSIEVDSEGVLWASTTKSVLRINLQTSEIISIPLDPNSPIKSFYNGCSAISPNGKIYFGGDNGYIEIDPKLTGKYTVAPSVYISKLYINNQAILVNDSSLILNSDIAFTNKLVLGASSNSLSFYFSTLDYWLPSENTFQYKLQNFDKDWQFTTGKKNFAVYSNLPSGDYVLKVRGSNYMGIPSTNETSIHIIVKPPLFLSKGFLILYFVILAALIIISFKIYGYRQKLRNELQFTRLEKQHSEELLQVKQQFFTNISHEFRTPLSLIVPPIQQVLNSGKIDAESRQLLQLAGKNSKRLLKLVNQILDFRKMERNNLQLVKTNVEVVGFCYEVYNSFSELADRHNISYKFTSKLKQQFNTIDIEKMETVLFNLLSNAFKYTYMNGNIQVKMRNIDSDSMPKIEIVVEDDGEGIPIEDQENIFARFYQSGVGQRQNAGSGIGLSLAQEYVKLHNGSIQVKSAPNKGSCFTVILPIDNSPIEYMEPNSTSSHMSILNSTLLGNELSLNNIAEASAPRLLIIDDNEDILDFIKINLGSNYNLYTAINGQQGLDMALQYKPNLIISDIMMPVMDGILLCKHLKDNAQTAQIPVILLTAKSLDNQKIEGMNIGAAHYITKPFDIQYLISCIESVFRREKMIQQYIKTTLLVAPTQSRSVDSNQDEVFLKKVMNFIEKNIGNTELSVELLSVEMGMSTTHLYRRLKAITQQSTIDIIKKYRLNIAAQMIKNNEGNVTEIMYAVGFSSLSSFSKSFKDMHGILPSESFKQRHNK